MLMYISLLFNICHALFEEFHVRVGIERIKSKLLCSKSKMVLVELLF